MPEVPTLRRVRFGVFEADLRAGELRKQGRLVRLQEQPFQVLTLLLERRGEIVTRDEVRNALWPADTFVDFDHGLNKAVSKLREALGDSAQSPRFVETVARRGYRFVADVQTVEADPAAEPISPTRAALVEPALADEVVSSKHPIPPPEPPAEAHAARPPHSRNWKLGAAALLIIAVALGSWRLRGHQATPSVRSLAVLPMESVSSDASQDYFADGMTDELITDLGQISALRVISRTSVMAYKRARKPLPQIARELDVDAVVEGTVLLSGDRVRITAQLIDASTDKQLWSHRYEGDLSDTLTLQKEVARAIADEIRINLSPREQAALESADSVNADAYRAYLKGRYFWSKRTSEGLRAALGYFNEAIDDDAKYARAYSGLADTYALLGDWEYAAMEPKDALPKAKAAATKALELDAQLAEAHNSLAFCLETFDWNFDAAGKEFQTAIALSPGYATAHHWYAWHLSLMGRTEAAIAEMKRAEGLDPLSLIIMTELAELLITSHAYDEAIQQSRKTLGMDPSFALAHNQLGEALLQKHDYESAFEELKQAVRLSGGSPTCTANLARAYIAAGELAEADTILKDLEERSSAAYPDQAEIAAVYAARGQLDRALDWLERGYEARFNPSVLLRPGFDALRADPRFKALLVRIGLSH